jgi:hypothetical protein
MKVKNTQRNPVPIAFHTIPCADVFECEGSLRLKLSIDVLSPNGRRKYNYIDLESGYLGALHPSEPVYAVDYALTYRVKEE